jgi:hypothetical protein
MFHAHDLGRFGGNVAAYVDAHGRVPEDVADLDAMSYARPPRDPLAFVARARRARDRARIFAMIWDWPDRQHAAFIAAVLTYLNLTPAELAELACYDVEDVCTAEEVEQWLVGDGAPTGQQTGVIESVFFRQTLDELAAAVDALRPTP